MISVNDSLNDQPNPLLNPRTDTPSNAPPALSYRRRRRPLLAFFYAAISAVLGMLYVGRGGRALVYLFCELASFALAKTAALLDIWTYTPAAAVGLVIVKTVGILDTFRLARQQRVHFDGPWYSYWYGAPLIFVVMLTSVTGIYVFLLGPAVVTSNSMVPGLYQGDYLMVYKWPFEKMLPFHRSAPAIYRGEILLFKLPDDPNQLFVKRIIGLPGDRITINRNQILINNTPITRQRIITETPGQHYIDYQESFPAVTYRVRYNDLPFPEANQQYTVPENALFALGDNRDQSFDSRFWTNSFIPIDNVIGKPLFIWWSESTTAYSPVRVDRIGLRVE